jgi:hypothetical protein
LVSGSTTTFNVQSGPGSLSLFLDADLLSVGGNVLQGLGGPIADQGTLHSMLSTCSNPGNPSGNGINCGDFGASNSFMLTDAGKSFFILPNPFYSLSFQSGHLNNFAPTRMQTINGSLDVVFSGEPTDVPEPASVGSLGLGMLSLYAARRRSKKAA